MKKKILAFALCMLLVANPCFASSTGVVTVSGGSIATGGLSGGYSQATESAAITLTMAMLHGLGISVKLSQDAINAGQSAYSFVRNKFAEWVGGTSAEQLDDSQYEELKSRFQVINNGSNIDPDGNIYFNATAVDLIRRFLNWLDVSHFINDNTQSGSGSGTTVNGTLFTNSYSYTTIDNDVWRDEFSSEVAVAVVDARTTGQYQIFYYSPSSFRINRYKNNKLLYSNLSSSKIATYYNYRVCAGTINYLPSNLYHVTSDEFGTADTGIRKYLTYLNGDFNQDTSSGEEQDGLNYEGDFDPDVLNNPDDNNLVVQPDLVPALEDQNQGQQLNIPVQEYLEALKQVLNQATNPQAVPEPIPAQDLPTLTPVPVSVPADLPLEWPVELPSSPDATPDLPTDNTPVTDPSEPVNPVDALPELTFNLDEYFPFCIPFDVYHLLSKFSSDPVTPVFDIGFTEPFTNTNVNYHIDLSPWDSVASAIRTAELGAFIVGLAVASRAIFTRG